jgi:hypothetical protein
MCSRARLGVLVFLLAGLGLMVGIADLAGRPTTVMRQPPVSPKPLRLIIEGEDFKPVEGDWQVQEFGTNYYAATLAVTFLSRGRYLGAPEQGVASRAVREIEVPRDGSFEVWARYEQPYDYSVEFELTVEQDGKAVFQRGYGRKDGPKLWAFKKGFQPQVLWDWGPGDNIVWEGRGTKVDLKQGKAKLYLTKGTQKDAQAARRNVDVIVLTDDQAGIEKQLKNATYLPLDGWLTQEGDVSLMVTNPAGEKGAIAVKVGPCTEHSPYWIHVRDWPKELWIGRKASEEPLPREWYLDPGQSYGDVEVGRFFDTLNAFQWRVQVIGEDGKPAANRRIQLSFGGPPKFGKADVIRQGVYTTGPDGSVVFFLDSDIRRTKRIRTVDEDLEGLLKTVVAFPPKGKRPEKYLMYGIMGATAGVAPNSRTAELVRDLELALGSNTLPIIQQPEKNGFIDVRDIPTKDLKAHCDRLKQDGTAARLKVVSLGDEIHIGGSAKSPDDDPAFRDFLKGKKLAPADLKLKSLDEAKIELKDKTSRLYYWSHLFSFEKALAELKERTDILEANLGKHLTIGANYSPHPYYWPKEGQWARAFKRRAMTLPWSEDYVWQVPEASPQIIGYMMAALRCGAVDHNLPIHWYVMPHYPGNTPDNLRRAYYSAIGHGAKQLNFFCATPLSVAYTENYVTSEATETWKTIHELVQETGLFEHVTFDAKTRQGDCALLLSFAQDLWDADPAYNHERKCLYLALRQSGYTVDFVTEEDIQNDALKKRKITSLFIVGNHLETATANVLKEWVKAGGALGGYAGGGFLNEHNEPMDVLKPVYGIKDQKIERRDTVIMTKQQLPRLQPLDRISTKINEVKRDCDALAFKQALVLGDAEVEGKYKDGSPAVVRKEYGNGVGMLFGSFVCSSYIRAGIPLRPFDRSTRPDGFNHFLPTDFDGELVDLVTAPAGWGSARYDVITTNPQVETVVMDGPNGVAVAIINWLPEPQDLTLTIQYIPAQFTKVTSLKKGPLAGVTRRGVVVDFKLRVDVTDMVLIER